MFQGRYRKRNRKQIPKCKLKQNRPFYTIISKYFRDSSWPTTFRCQCLSRATLGSQTSGKIQSNLELQNTALPVLTRHTDKSPTSGLSQSIQGDRMFFSSLKLYWIKRQNHCVVSRNISMYIRALCLLIKLTAYCSKLHVIPAHLSAAVSQCHFLAHQSPAWRCGSITSPYK